METLRHGVKILLGTAARCWVACFGTTRAMILTYHSISDSPWIHAVSPNEFRRQMRWLSAHAKVVPLSEIGRIAAEGMPRTRTPVVAITFDDGYRDWIENAMPILREFHLPATFFVTTSFKIVASTPQEVIAPLRPEDVTTLASAGFEIGGHGHTHRDLSSCTDDELMTELTESRRILRELSGQDVTRMSYPKGRLDVARRRKIGDAGFTFAVAGIGAVGKGTDPFAAPKVPVIKPRTLPLLIARISQALVGGTIGS